MNTAGEKIDFHALQAGPELDALVHAEVMGIKWDEKRCRICGWPLYERIEQGCVLENCCLRPAPARRADSIPPYSTEFHMAWLIVEKMAEKHSDLYIEKAGLNWHFSTPLAGEDALTPALAICRASLKEARGLVDWPEAK
jgi:hypothetical protein